MCKITQISLYNKKINLANGLFQIALKTELSHISKPICSSYFNCTVVLIKWKVQRKYFLKSHVITEIHNKIFLGGMKIIKQRL